MYLPTMARPAQNIWIGPLCSVYITAGKFGLEYGERISVYWLGKIFIKIRFPIFSNKEPI